MTKTIALFSGQGSQFVGMGKELWENFPKVKEIYECGEDITKLPLRKLSFEGSLEDLSKTQVTQPAVFALSVAAFTAALEIMDPADGVAGHSLGEFAALYAAGAFSLEDGFRILSARTAAMEGIGAAAGGMSAILRLPYNVVEEICNKVTGVIVPANKNLPEQTVISGELESLEEAEQLLSEVGGRVIRLKVSRGFHSPLMTEAAKQLKEEVKYIEFSKTTLPFFSNITGKLTNFHQEKTDYPEYFAKQMVSGVNFVKEMDAFNSFGMAKAIEFGPKKTLVKFVGSYLPRVRVAQVSDIKTLKQLQER